MALAIHVLKIAPTVEANKRATATVTVGADFQGVFEVWKTENGHVVQGAQTCYPSDVYAGDLLPGPPAFTFTGKIMAKITDVVLKAYEHKCPSDKPFSLSPYSLQNREQT